MKIKSFILVLLMLIMGGNLIKAQTDEVTYHTAPIQKDTSKIRDNDWLRYMSVGGNFGLQVGTYTHIEASPHIAYHPKDWFSVGLGATYMFFRTKYSPNEIYNTHIIGGSVFTEAYFLRIACVHLEYQLLNFDDRNPKAGDPMRIWSNNFMLGGGFYQKTNQRSAFYLLLLYNITDKPEKNILSNPVFKAGFTIWLNK